MTINTCLLSADYSQIELRVMAELSGDPAMLEAFTAGDDIHTTTASKVFKVPVEEVTREMRDKAKTVNFGIIYGISAFGLQQRLNIPRAEASELIENYFEKYPGVRSYIDDTIAFARKHGYVATRTGRRRYIRDINSRSRTVASAAERLAMNSPIQGTAADMLKLAMINVLSGAPRGWISDQDGADGPRRNRLRHAGQRAGDGDAGHRRGDEDDAADDGADRRRNGRRQELARSALK